MSLYKSNEEVEIQRQSCLMVSKTLAEIAKMIKPGMRTIELDDFAYTFIRDNGGYPSFKGYHGFPYSLCISVNEQVVHGFPGQYELKEGDIVSVDCGVYMNGFHGDHAYTFIVGEVPQDILDLVRITKESLYLGAEKAIVGNRVGDIAH